MAEGPPGAQRLPSPVGQIRSSHWLGSAELLALFQAFALGKPVPCLPTAPSVSPEYLLHGLGQLWLRLILTPLPGDAAVMDSVSPDVSHAISSETIPVATAQQTASSKDYWLKQCDVWSSCALLTEVKSARSIEFRQLPPKPTHFLHLQPVWKPWGCCLGQSGKSGRDYWTPRCLTGFG